MLLKINKTLENNMPTRVTNPSIAELHFTEEGSMYISRNDGTFQRIEHTTNLKPDMKILYEGNFISETTNYTLSDDVTNYNMLLLQTFTSDISASYINNSMLINKTQFSDEMFIDNVSFTIQNNILTTNGQEGKIMIIGLI